MARVWLCSVLLAFVQFAGGGRVGAATVTPPTVSPAFSSLTLTLPSRGLGPQELALLVAQGDPLSEAVAAYYQAKRGIPAANIIRVAVPGGADAISETVFSALKAQIDAQLPAGVQATLVTWTAPSRVTGACTMGLTSALAFGYSPAYCANTCASTKATAYYDSESTRPWQDHQIRPSIMLGATTLAGAQELIDRGFNASATMPIGDGYLLRTTDVARSVRYRDYVALPALWAGNSGLTLRYRDNAGGTGGNTVTDASNVLFYFTGLTTVPGIASNRYRPGAVADHLTSFGGFLPDGNGQMPITAWLDAGATASYGTVAEPCNFRQKFSKASVLIDHYFRGDTVIEAYWKSVAWPGQGLFVGDPLAQPFQSTTGFSISGTQYTISTRALRAGSNYSLEYRTAASDAWTVLASFTIERAQPSTLTAPLAPANATQLRWVGPCGADTSQRCTLATSG